VALLVEDGQEQIFCIICSLPEPLQQRSLTARTPRRRLQTRTDLSRLAAEPLHKRIVPGARGVRSLELGTSFEEAVDAGDVGVRDLHKSAKAAPRASRKQTGRQRCFKERQ
jgi:hypothetical protein